MGIQIGAKPDSGFDDPIGMLVDCHRRVEHFLNILCVVVGRARGRVLSDEESEAVLAALQYFRVGGGERHNADEEESLFPRLKGQIDDCAFEELDRLERDHRVAGELHRSVDVLYRRWIADGGLPESDYDQLASNAEALKQLYAAHIRVEEQAVFPRAAEILDRETVERIGQEFRRRRA